MSTTRHSGSHPTLSRAFSLSLLGLVIGLGTGRAVADDTEIFFPEEVLQDDSTVVRPNLMFLMDTSGSMGTTTDTGSGGLTRLRRMQNALTEVLDSLGSNINVGLGRLSGSEGGAILFPAADLDAVASTIDPTLAVQLDLSNVPAPNGEAQQNVSTVTLGPSTAGSQVLLLGSLGAASPITARFPIGKVANEAEQNDRGSNNNVDTDDGDDNRTSSNFSPRQVTEQAPDGNNRVVQHFGLRFEGVTLPSDATISTARIIFTCATAATTVISLSNTDAAKVTIESGFGSLPFERARNNITSRGVLGTTINWGSTTNTIPACTTANVTTVPLDVKSLVDAFRAQGAQANGKPMTFRFQMGSAATGNNNRSFRAFDGGNNDVAPRLEITYTTSQTASQQFGLHFDNVYIPRGVDISSAYVTFQGLPGINPDRTNAGGALSAQIGVVVSQAPFAAASNAVTGAVTGTKLNWSIPLMGRTVSNVQTPDISSILEARTSQSDWCGGESLSLTFTLSGTPGGLRAFASGLDASVGPTLSFSYSDSDTALDSSCTTQAAVRPVTSGDNDANETVSTGTFMVSANPITLGRSGANEQIVGLRFDTLDLPPGTIIQSARIDFVASGSDSGTLPLRITGHNVGNSPPFGIGLSEISTRRSSFGTASISWSPVNWTSGATYSTPDLSSMVQTIIDRTDWVNKGAISFLIDSPTSAASVRRRANSYETSTAYAPKLYITAQVPTARLKVRAYLKKLVSEFQADGFTPVPEFMYEAARYWRGEGAHFGKTRGDGATTGSDGDSISPNRTSRISGPATFTEPPTVTPGGCSSSSDSSCASEKITNNAIYDSPFTDLACSTNAQILLSDGLPNSIEPASVTLIRNNLLGGGTCTLATGLGDAQIDNDREGTCAAEIASLLNNTDQSPGASGLTGSQTVSTYTVGLNAASAAGFLNSVATAGGGSYFQASTAADLVNAFNSIVQRVLDIPTTFVAPAVSVNSFNRLSDRNEIYFALFRPNLEARWEGNFKRYRIGGNSSGQPIIVDSAGAVAVDQTTGFFRNSARSFWSATADGNNVGDGGVVDRFTLTRNTYTNTGSSAASNAGSATAPAEVTLSASTNLLNSTNVTVAMLGDTAMSTGERDNIINFARGVDAYDQDGDGSRTDIRLAFADPLHSEPALVNYGGTEAAPDSTAFVGTNEGGLHAFNATTGDELWHWVPQELLPNLTRYARNTGNYKNRPYGLDGSITPLYRTATGKHLSFYQDGTSVFLYVGMRMGGRQYYALDVTNRSTPKLKFIVRGGGTGAYRELGESWGKPIPALIKVNGDVRSTIVLSGGYDRKQDAELYPSADGMGRAVFIMDSNTGERIWWGGINPGDGNGDPNLAVPQMRFSIPATPKVVDLDGDGISDRIYVADVGGQVFRFDLSPTNTGPANLATVTRVAALGTAGAELTGRRFYQTPDVSIVRPNGVTPFVAIAIGSGYRGHPLNKGTQDRFYVLRDPDVGKLGVALPTKVAATGSFTDANLYDATANAVGSSNSTTATAAKVALNNADGFFVNLQTSDGALEGEKVLTDSQTFDSKVLFTSYTPAARSVGATCRASAGLSRFYLFSIVDGQPVQNYDQVGAENALTQTDRYFELAQGGLPPTPTILFPTISGVIPKEPLVCVGAECFNPGFTLASEKTYWIKRQ